MRAVLPRLLPSPLSMMGREPWWSPIRSGPSVLSTLQGFNEDSLFLSITDRITKLNAGFDERGILGFASHPDFLRTGKIYVYYSAPLGAHADQEWDHTSRISEFSVYENDPELVDPRSERILLTFDQPYFNHNAGALAFGPQDGLSTSRPVTVAMPMEEVWVTRTSATVRI